MKRKINLILNTIVSVWLLITSVVYATIPNIMPYHKKALGLEYDNLGGNLKLLLTLSIKTSAAGFLSVSIACLFVIFFANKHRWSRYFLLVVNSCWLTPMFIIGVLISKHTGAATPWPFAALLIVLTIMAFLFKTNE